MAGSALVVRLVLITLAAGMGVLVAAAAHVPYLQAQQQAAQAA